ncbi:magnesium transporter [Adhaeribacter arboris]|uniref:Magnesium transporter MgtE n=1 Tax=Adhaeribacter arboris TaxID=2072846 RepID=A0A2T2YNJ7_9BACT|nr:magnesium transporter [Adhaeribacter arboris]PSR57066.1 magnesium transporter [Adhaeribacter arboris]
MDEVTPVQEFNSLHPNDLAEILAAKTGKEKVLSFLLLPPQLKTETFSYLNINDQEEIIKSLGSTQVAEILNKMAPDDRTKLFVDIPDELIKGAINLLSEEERKIAVNLLGYPENSIGRIMTPNYVQAKKDWTIAKTLQHIKTHGKKAETLNFIYVVNEQNKLLDDIQIGKLLLAEENATMEQLMDNSFISLRSLLDKEEAIKEFEKYDRSALPVVTDAGILVGIVTVDDILDVIERRDTEDIQKFGGLEALEIAYTETPILTLFRKRAGWLIVLFLSEMLTATAMGYFEDEIAKAVILALFVPLIISSGGNSGSQAATLIIRAMALREITLKDWWYVMRREFLSGFLLGSTLGILGFIRIFLWQETGIYDYGDHWQALGLTVGFSLLGIVMWGTFSGAMIPFLLRTFKLDPATSSAPFVATLVDVTGLVIYFTVASIILSGKLL